jgi:hypothetical protein
MQGFALLGLVFSAWLTEMVKHHEEYFRNITENANTTLADFKFLVELECKKSFLLENTKIKLVKSNSIF